MKSVIITGGAGLIGKPLAYYLNGLGYHIIVVDKVKPAELNNQIDYIEFDLTDIDGFDNLKKAIRAKTDNVKGLINNAAFNPMIEKNSEGFGKFENLKLSDWNDEMLLNLTSPVFLIKNILDLFNLDDGKNCKIINVLSVYGIVPPDQAIYRKYAEKIGKEIIKPITYSVSKAALGMVTKYLAVYLAKRNINVNAIAPGGIENAQDESFVSEYVKRTPVGRMAEPSDLFEAFAFLLSPGSDYLTGQTITIDGGWTVW